jgi:hypothetical protein
MRSSPSLVLLTCCSASIPTVERRRESVRGKVATEDAERGRERGPGTGMPWKRSPKWCRKPSAAAGLPPRVRHRKRRTLEKLGMEPSEVHTTSTKLFF